MCEIEVRPMTAADVDGVLTIEQLSFSQPWSREAFESEVTENELAHYLVVATKEKIVAYAGSWLILDEAHVTNVAVLPEFRGHGVGAVLLAALIAEVKQEGAERMTLEVRKSNEVAKRLYAQFGFEAKGIRKQYYTDTGEDALIMWVEL